MDYINYFFRTEPQPTACQAMKGQRCSWTRGKVLGGSSVLNTMIYIRGNRRDFDRWEALGNHGWGYKDVLPYFLKSQDQRNPYLAKNKYHRTGKYLDFLDISNYIRKDFLNPRFLRQLWTSYQWNAAFLLRNY